MAARRRPSTSSTGAGAASAASQPPLVRRPRGQDGGTGRFRRLDVVPKLLLHFPDHVLPLPVLLRLLAAVRHRLIVAGQGGGRVEPGEEGTDGGVGVAEGGHRGGGGGGGVGGRRWCGERGSCRCSAVDGGGKVGERREIELHGDAWR
nr:unnamed protein product [Digitaria exilis]